jgi:hypothetical protein
MLPALTPGADPGVLTRAVERLRGEPERPVGRRGHRPAPAAGPQLLDLEAEVRTANRNGTSQPERVAVLTG